MGFAVFLDVDGVLNTSTTVKQTPYGYTGIDDARLKFLHMHLKNMVEETLFFHLIGKNLIPSMMIMCISYQN